MIGTLCGIEIFILMKKCGLNTQNTLMCLDSLEKMSIPKEYSVEVLIINNYPPEELEIENIYKTFTLTLIQNSEYTGFSGGHNKGIAYAEVRTGKEAV